jgi:hypothetical protein
MLHPVYALRRTGHSAEYNASVAYTALQDFCEILEDGYQHYLTSLRQMGLYLYGEACRQAGKRLFLDKTPRYYFIIPELSQIFPNARIIILLRNPVAVLSSIINTWVRGNWLLLGDYYYDLVVAPRLLLAGIELLKDRAIVVHYEDLVIDPGTQMEHLCRRLEIVFYPEMIEYGNTSASQGRLGDPVGIHRHGRPTTANLDKWQELGKSRQTRYLANMYLQELGPDVVSRLGYDFDRMLAILNSGPCKREVAVISWEQIFQTNKSFLDKLCLVSKSTFQQRRFLYSRKQVFEWLLQRLPRF